MTMRPLGLAPSGRGAPLGVIVVFPAGGRSLGVMWRSTPARIVPSPARPARARRARSSSPIVFGFCGGRVLRSAR